MESPLHLSLEYPLGPCLELASALRRRQSFPTPLFPNLPKCQSISLLSFLLLDFGFFPLLPVFEHIIGPTAVLNPLHTLSEVLLIILRSLFADEEIQRHRVLQRAVQ